MSTKRLPSLVATALLALAAAPAFADSDPSEHACARQIQKFVSFREPDSVKVVSVSDGKAEVIDYANTRLVAVKFTVMVNSRGERGGYTGARPYQCWTSQDRQRVLDYQPKHD